MSSITYLVYYCVLILFASVFGGMIPVWWNLTHRWMEIAVSFVAGIIFGVAMLHMLPDAILSALVPGVDPSVVLMRLMLWFVAGFLTMFFIERFFCFHHHEAPADGESEKENEHHHDHGHACSHTPHSDHVHDITWTGAAVGLTLHSVLGGIALGASVMHGHGGGILPGLGTFLVIFLHKPFDAMTIGTLMARSGWSLGARSLVNGLFSLAIPLGAGLFLLGESPAVGPTWCALPAALAFSAGVFLCIAGSDLLPELQFHHHDRWKLSAALLFGIFVAYAAGQLEGHKHQQPPAPAAPPAEVSPANDPE